jgi:phosphoribosylaminoimidazole-succinocarboxamide synthase
VNLGLPDVGYRGSVKDVLGPVTLGNSESIALFRYSDAYSIFDWGKMPDALPAKGQALAVLAAWFFERLESPAAWKDFSRSRVSQSLRKGVTELPNEWEGPSRVAQTTSAASGFNELGETLQQTGLRTHYRGVLKPSAKGAWIENLVPLEKAAGGLPQMMAVQAVKVVRPEIKRVLGRSVPDYEPVRRAQGLRLVPLEVVFRFSCPKGSSYLERNPEQSVGSQFEFPVIELFTKLESADRLLGLSEGLAISGLSSAQLQDLLLRTAWVAGFIRWAADQAGLELADGKLEWATDEAGRFILVDAIGPDELRLMVGGSKDGIALSKEFLREAYRGSDWYSAVKKAKQLGQSRGLSDWKRFVSEAPSKLSGSDLAIGSQLYPVLTNVLTGKKWFEAAWSLDHLVGEIRKRGGARAEDTK